MVANLLIFGAAGQLGSALRDLQPPNVITTYADIEECDLTNPQNVASFIEQIKPDVIVNCAAYTAVDKAEEDVELAGLINRDAVGFIAENCADKCKLIHISTDFVFDGNKTSAYLPGDGPNPLGIYGETKLAGEVAALNRNPEHTMIIRTAWLYSEYGNNFLRTMLRLMSEKDELGVVDDQRGAPTCAASLAEVIWRVLTQDNFRPGIYHWTDEGDITWYDFAKAIQQEAIAEGLLTKETSINPITTEDYPAAAARPAYSVLDNSKLANLTGLEPIPWRESLRATLRRIKANR